jgi:hypothetical protein
MLNTSPKKNDVITVSSNAMLNGEEKNLEKMAPVGHSDFKDIHGRVQSWLQCR